MEKLRINLSTAYGLVIEQCTDYLRLRLEGQEKWEATSNECDLLGILKIIKSLSHKYDNDTEDHHVAYHTLLRQFILLRQGGYSTQSGGHEGHATGGIWDEGKDGGKAPHQPEHGIRPSARAVHGLPAVAYWGTG